MVDGKADFDRALGAKIREVRERAGVKQDALARAVGLSRTSVTNIERGRQGVQAYLLVRIAEVLGQPAAYLLPGQESWQSPEKVNRYEASTREWAERVLGSPKGDGSHAA